MHVSLTSNPFSNKLRFKSDEQNLRSYHVSFSSEGAILSRGDESLVTTDGHTFLDFLSTNTKLNIQKERDFLIDHVIDQNGEICFKVNRRSDTNLVYANTTISFPSTGKVFKIQYHQMTSLVLPIKVSMCIEEESDLEVAMTLLLLTWIRYEYESHDQFY